IVGLSEHFRDLMVCKDPATVELLQVSDSAKERYLAQAGKVQLSFLLSGLNVCNQADIHYKSSKNQRLHVELALMKLSQLPHPISLAALAQEEPKKKALVPQQRHPLLCPTCWHTHAGQLEHPPQLYPTPSPSPPACQR